MMTMTTMTMTMTTMMMTTMTTTTAAAATTGDNGYDDYHNPDNLGKRFTII
jgi:hypothetical protein